MRVYDRALDADEIMQLAARQAAITIASSRNLLTTEAGTSDSFTVVLDAAPTANVTIGISSDDPSEGLAMPASVTFTPANWDVPQTVLVTGVDDLDVDDAVDYLIVTSPAFSVDAHYNGLDAADISVVNMDNDGPGGPHDYVAYWKLDEGDGGTAIDSSGGGNHGTLLGGADTTGWIADVAPTGFSNRYALDFDGTNDSVGLPAGGSLEIGGNAVSISLWVKLDELPNAISGETYAGIFDSEQDSFVIYEDDKSDELRFKVTDADGTAERPGIPASKLDTVRWHHVVGVYNGAAAEALIYLDGSLADSHFNSSLTGQVKPGQIPALGRNGAGSKYFYNGQIDDVRVYDRALSQAEIFSLSGQIAQIALLGFLADTPRANSEWPLARIEDIKDGDGPWRKTEEPVNEYMAAQVDQPVPISWNAPFSEPSPSDDEFETIPVEGSGGFESSVDVLMERC